MTQSGHRPFCWHCAVVVPWCARVLPSAQGATPMRRRNFIAGLASTAAAWPVAAFAQQPRKLPTIGFLGANNATFARSSTDAFVQRLRELGWIENQNVAIEYRW